MQQVHLFISGRVQGVGYRKFVQYHARKLGLTGWVQNLPDRRVEAVIQGEKEKIEKLIKNCHKGPLLSEVVDVQKEWQHAPEIFNEFKILKPQQ